MTLPQFPRPQVIFAGLLAPILLASCQLPESKLGVTAAYSVDAVEAEMTPGIFSDVKPGKVSGTDSQTLDADGPCVPACLNSEGGPKLCGDDGCGGTCGYCPPGVLCIEGQCLCTADCLGKECGPDGCGDYCGTGDPSTQGCTGTGACENGKCVSPCVPSCSGKECGLDGCFGSCGTCPCDGCASSAIECDGGTCVDSSQCNCECIFDCFDTCPGGDQACYQDCVNSASIEAQMAYNNLTTCLDGAGYWDCADNDQECLADAFDLCMDPYYECFHGDLSCVDMYLCLVNCPGGESGYECPEECYANGTVEALKLWDIFIDCLIGSGYYDCPYNGDASCEEEAYESCDAEFKACAHGNLDCGDILDCRDACAPTDQVCSLSCVLHASQEAGGQWDVLIECIENQCGLGAAPECEMAAIEGACASAHSACIDG